jgi:zinc D-Ala-D-Ala dipeptidase
MKNLRTIFFIAFLLSAFFSCEEKVQRPGPQVVPRQCEKISEALITDSTNKDEGTSLSSLEKTLISAGLVNIGTIDSTIKVDLKYSTCDNFLFMDLYGDLDKAYLQPEVALKLKNAQQNLREKYPYYSLIVYDAVRPVRVQTTMWDTLKLPFNTRSKYVSNPQNGSLHNFGAAVDLSIIDENGIELDMGTPYDYFGELAYPREEERMIKEGKLSYKQLLNRTILRDAMVKAGFMDITTEWWHFNSCFRSQAILKYKIIE